MAVACLGLVLVTIFIFSAATCIMGEGSSNDPRVITDEQDLGGLHVDDVENVLRVMENFAARFVDRDYFETGTRFGGRLPSHHGGEIFFDIALEAAEHNPIENFRCEAAPPTVPTRLPLSGIQIQGIFRNMVFNFADYVRENLPGYYRAAFNAAGTMHTIGFTYVRTLFTTYPSSSPALRSSFQRLEDEDYFGVGCRSEIFTTLFAYWPHNTLLQGRSLHSPDGQVELRMQEDCNLVIYIDGWRHALWASLTYTTRRDVFCRFTLKLDGSAEIQRSDNGGDFYAVWKSGSECQGEHCVMVSFLSVRNDGSMRIYEVPDTPKYFPNQVWDSRTRR